jgi:response regulator RpfG family c-di-GMP phosphodiesterase
MNMIDQTFRGRLMARILLAEDDEDMRRFLARALENAGYQVVSFNNGQSAYERLREEPFHLLLDRTSSCRRWTGSSWPEGERARSGPENHVHHRDSRPWR